jgi:hypothetical protein
MKYRGAREMRTRTARGEAGGLRQSACCMARRKTLITMGAPYFVWTNANEIISSWYVLGAGCVAPPPPANPQAHAAAVGGPRPPGLHVLHVREVARRPARLRPPRVEQAWPWGAAVTPTPRPRVALVVTRAEQTGRQEQTGRHSSSSNREMPDRTA